MIQDYSALDYVPAERVCRDMRDLMQCGKLLSVCRWENIREALTETRSPQLFSGMNGNWPV